MDKIHIRLKRLKYRNIFIVQDRNWWTSCKADYDVTADLVLTLDFALKKQITNEGGEAEFLDHLLTTEYLEQYNHYVHFFLSDWFKNEVGKDYFNFEGIDVGNAFMLNILNDVTYTVHFFLNLLVITKLEYSKLTCALEDKYIISLLEKLGMNKILILKNEQANYSTYYFPIVNWMKETVEKVSWRYKIKNCMAIVIDGIFNIVDYINSNNRKYIYVQNYFPTKDIINILGEDKRVKIVLRNYTGLKGISRERRIYFPNRVKVDSEIIENLWQKYINGKRIKWEVEGIMLSDILYNVIEPIIKRLLPICCSRINVIKRFFRQRELKLMVPITDLWMENRLTMNYCKWAKVPIFMIVNGMLTFSYEKDARDSDWVNCYSDTIKEDYFFNDKRVFSLGDPRMDHYALKPQKVINRRNPTIIIGSAGYNIIDLNSYLSYEFDFLFDILNSCQELLISGKQLDIIIKVRANCYIEQYQHFVEEYFKDLKINIVQHVPFGEIINAADLYITFYSQTLLEASCLGIPVIFYKKDTQNINRPFNSDSELVTAFDTEDLKKKIELFYDGDKCYDSFLDKKVMEKYIGPLDGQNASRNIAFIYDLLNK